MNKDIEEKIKREGRSVALIINKAEKLALIKTDEDVTRATEVLVKVKRQIKDYEGERQEYTKPINESLRKLNARFKELTEPLKNAEIILKDAIVAYRAIKEKERAKQEEDLQKKGGNTDITVNSSLPDIVESKSGESRVTKKWTFEVIDEKRIPRSYLILDEKKVNAAIQKEKVRKIAGLKIYQKESISVYQ